MSNPSGYRWPQPYFRVLARPSDARSARVPRHGVLPLGTSTDKIVRPPTGQVRRCVASPTPLGNCLTCDSCRTTAEADDSRDDRHSPLGRLLGTYDKKRYSCGFFFLRPTSKTIWTIRHFIVLESDVYRKDSGLCVDLPHSPISDTMGICWVLVRWGGQQGRI